MIADSTRLARSKPTRRLGPTGLLAALVPLVLCAILSLWEPFGVRALRDLEFDAFQRWAPSLRPREPGPHRRDRRRIAAAARAMAVAAHAGRRADQQPLGRGRRHHRPR